MILNAMFDAGDNIRHNLRWQLYSTPPATAWREMIEHTLANPKDRAINILESTFCKTQWEARASWGKFLDECDKIGFEVSKLKFEYLDRGYLERVKNELFLALDTKQTDIQDALGYWKTVAFWFNNKGGSEGHIYYFPDPHFVVDWDPDWNKFLTMDIKPGELYAEITYHIRPWFMITDKPFEENRDLATHPLMGHPAQLGSGFILSFGQGSMSGIKVALANYFDQHENDILEANPNFDTDKAWKMSGKLPLGKIIEKPSYDAMREMKRLVKLELMERW